jgi:hypothetical protein
LHSLYEDRFARPYATADRALRERIESLAAELAAREAARRDTLAIIAGEIEQSLQHDERLQAVLRELGAPTV